MREDMFKVIVERPRKGRHYSRPVPKLRQDDVEDGGPSHGPMRPYGYKSKWLNENLSPLYRFLEKSVGRHWDRVYAEICEGLSTGSTVQQHVRTHLTDYVATCTSLCDGGICIESIGWRRVRYLKDSTYPFYVHPVSRMLLVNRFHLHRRRLEEQRREGEAARLAQRRRDVAPGIQLHRLNEIWFEVKLAQRPPTREPVRDVVIDAGLSLMTAAELYGKTSLYAFAKRQLSKKELRQAGLRS